VAPLRLDAQVRTVEHPGEVGQIGTEQPGRFIQDAASAARKVLPKRARDQQQVPTRAVPLSATKAQALRLWPSTRILVQKWWRSHGRDALPWALVIAIAVALGLIVARALS